MTRLLVILYGILAAGIAVTALTFGSNLILNRRNPAGMAPREQANAVPLWRGLVAVLGLAAIVFSIHALLYVHRSGGLTR